MTEDTLTLSQLNTLVKNLLEGSFDYPFWVVAEIAECKVAAQGHCYIELVEKSEKSKKLLARSRATIWRDTFPLLKTYFEEVTGQIFTEGIKAMLMVEVRFHPLYGYSLNVVDINPTFTIGEMALQREKILRELDEQGILNLNKELDFPVLPQRIAVISSESAAGYEDFLNELENNIWQYHFNVKLFPAIMQGDNSENSVIAALENIFAAIENFDVVVIIRGGGAKLDLTAFDNKNIAEHIAQFPLPVIAGIGHTKDRTILDMVAYKSEKTPTAVAEFLIQCFIEQDTRINNYLDAIENKISNIIENEYFRLHEIQNHFTKIVQFSLHQRNNNVDNYRHQIKQSMLHYLTNKIHMLDELPDKIKLKIGTHTKINATQLKNFNNRLGRAISVRLNREKQHLELLKNKTEMLQPENLLKRGYHLVTDEENQKIIKGFEQIKEKDILNIHFTKGIAKTQIVEKRKKY